MHLDQIFNVFQKMFLIIQHILFYKFLNLKLNNLYNRWAKREHIYHYVLEMQTYVHISKFQIF